METKENNKYKPFDLEQAKAGKPVYTRDGHKARIICFDAKLENYSIIALVKKKVPHRNIYILIPMKAEFTIRILRIA